MVVHPGESSRTPFLRGILVHSLQNAGLKFADAHAVANVVRDELESTREIGPDTLKLHVIDVLERMGYEEVVPAYRNSRKPLTIEIISRDGELTDFSRQEYYDQLKAIGLRADEGAAVVDHLHRYLLRRGGGPMSANTIARVIYRMLRSSQQFGKAVARRWLVWLDFIQSGRPMVILIGGTAGSGKSTLAADLASCLAITRSQSTDILREVIRSARGNEEQPLLHQSSFSAWKLLPEATKSQFSERDELIYEGFRHQADAMSSAIEAVIERATHEKVSMIMEGVHLRPAHVQQYQKSKDTIIIPLVLGVVKRKRLQQRLSRRSARVPQRRAERYLNHLDEICCLQSALLSEADEYGVPIILNEDKEVTFREIMLAVNERLSMDCSSSPEEVFG